MSTFSYITALDQVPLMPKSVTDRHATLSKLLQQVRCSVFVHNPRLQASLDSLERVITADELDRISNSHADEVGVGRSARPTRRG